MSSSNRVALRYVAETAWGTTPATPALKPIRFTSDTLNGNINTVVSDEIRDDRNQSDLIQVGSSAGGDVSVEYSSDTYNDLIEAAVGDTWTVDGVDPNMYTLKNGVVERSFTVQKHYADQSPQQYLNFPGSRVNTMSMEMAPNAIVTGQFGLLSKSSARTTTQFTGATFPARTTTTPFNAAANVNLMQIDDVAMTAGLMKFSMNVNNNLRRQEKIGSLAAHAIVQGDFECTGDFEIYFEDGTLYDKFINMTALKFEISMTDGAGNSLLITLPRIKFETAETPTQGRNTDVYFRATYRALYDSVSGYMIQLTRDAT